MNQFRGIPVVESGSKYRTTHGFKAIKNGVKLREVRGEAAAARKASKQARDIERTIRERETALRELKI